MRDAPHLLLAERASAASTRHETTRRALPTQAQAYRGRVEHDDLDDLVDRVPLGWSRHEVDGRAWGLTRVDHVDGRSSTIEGEELGGTGRMSANVWRTASGTHLKPCEMPAEQVLGVLRALPPQP